MESAPWGAQKYLQFPNSDSFFYWFICLTSVSKGINRIHLFLRLTVPLYLQFPFHFLHLALDHYTIFDYKVILNFTIPKKYIFHLQVSSILLKVAHLGYYTLPYECTFEFGKRKEIQKVISRESGTFANNSCISKARIIFCELPHASYAKLPHFATQKYHTNAKKCLVYSLDEYKLSIKASVDWRLCYWKRYQHTPKEWNCLTRYCADLKILVIS